MKDRLSNGYSYRYPAFCTPVRVNRANREKGLNLIEMRVASSIWQQYFAGFLVSSLASRSASRRACSAGY